MSNSPIDIRRLRDALSSFATGVTVITTADSAGEPVGVTASSFNSVSMEPPLVLWSVGKAAHSASAFANAGYFAIHILHAEQMNVSNAFAKSGTDKFSHAPFTVNENNVPHLNDFLTRFDCRTWQVYEGGDHWIIVGEVMDITSNNGSGLVFSEGSYSTASPISSTQSASSSAEKTEAPVENLLLYNLARANKQMGDQFHAAVQSCGLSIAEWRILASLQGEKSRDFPDLAARTFVDPASLGDIVSSLEEAGLCSTSNVSGSVLVSGNAKGHDRVEHLFKLGGEQESAAVGSVDGAGLTQLNELLRRVIANTNSTDNS